MSQSDRTQVAIVGAGYIADTHLAVLERTRNVEVTAIVDPDVERARRLAERYGVGSAFGSVEELVSAGVATCAHLLVPPALHAELARQLLENGISVLVEKPFALDSSTTRELHSLAERRGLHLAVNHNNVFHPAFQRLRRLLASGELGRIEQVFVCLHVPLRQLDSGDVRHWMFRQPGNIVFEQGPHPFSQVVTLLGPARTVACQRSGRRDLGNGRTFYDTWQISAECERGPATVLLSFGKGFAENWVQVIGTDGSVRIDLLRNSLQRLTKTPYMDFVDHGLQGLANARRSFGAAVKSGFDYVTSTLKLRERTDVFYVGMAGSLRAFHRSLRDNSKQPCDALHAAEVLDLCEAVTRFPEEAGDSAGPVAPSWPEPDPKPGRDVLVTGATGFLGRVLVEALLAEGQRVRLLVRDPSRIPEAWRPYDVRVVVGSIEDADAVDRAVRGAAGVCHLATGTGDSIEQLRGTMVRGCELIAQACLDHGVSRLLFTSSIAALYLGGSGPPLTEQTPADPKAKARAPYARAKAECEALLFGLHARLGLPVTVLRPGVVVGEGGLIQHSGVGLWTRDSECFGWGMGRHPLPFVLVEDVASAVVNALSAPGLEGMALNLVGDAQVSARGYVRELAKRTGRRYRFHPQPLLWLQTVEVAKWLVKRAVGRKDAAWPAYRDLRSRALTRPVDNLLAKRQLGWQPVADRGQFLVAALQWYADRDTAARAAGEGTFVDASAARNPAKPAPRPHPVSPDL